MDFDFWHERWAEKRIGFHRSDVNPNLLAHGPQWLGVPGWEQTEQVSGRVILVPLCGKAVELRWLAEHGARVIGVEFVPQAAESFFDEQKLTYQKQSTAWGTVLRSDTPGVAIEIWVADFLRLSPAALGPVDAIYDRAALVAVAPSLRGAYAKQLAELSSRGTQLLLIAFDHDLDTGPPFAVPAEEVKALLGENFAPTLIDDQDLLAAEPQFRERGANRWREQVWLGTFSQGARESAPLA